jgi:small subunit ribosomal protein S16
VLTLLERGGLVEKSVRPSVVTGQKKQAAAREAAVKKAAAEAAAEAKAAAEAAAEAKAAEAAAPESPEA